MKFISEVFKSNDEFSKFAKEVERRNFPICASGLSKIHKTVSVYSLCRMHGRKAVVITPDEAYATEVVGDFISLGTNAALLPVKDFEFESTVSSSKEYEQKRIDTLFKLLNGDFDVLVVPAEAAVQYTVPPEILKDNCFSLAAGDEIKTSDLITKLLACGYKKSLQVDGVGQFAVRGGIVDIFAANALSPVRIEFFGDEIDTINYFDIETQRRGDSVEKITVTPATETVADTRELTEKLTAYMQSEKTLSPDALHRISADIDMISNGITTCFDKYISFIYEKATVFDYLKDEYNLFLFDSLSVCEVLDGVYKKIALDTEDMLNNGIISKKNSRFVIEKSEFEQETSCGIFLENFLRTEYPKPIKSSFAFSFKNLPVWQGSIDVLLEDISYTVNTGGKCVVLAGEEKSAKVLYDTLLSKSIKASFQPSDTEKLSKGVTVMCGGLSGGFSLSEENFMLITQRYLYAEKRAKKAPKNDNSISSLDELKSGDYVVHISHGIGLFSGIHKITNSGITKDYIKINYAKGDVLYVPVTQLDLISKYIGNSESSSVKLNRLGSSEWNNTRKRVKHAVKNMAKELTKLYAKRMSVKGYAFSKDTELQREFESKFPFVETDDQIRCINEIKADMQKDIPMDRLLCGDVGFGKTEVALRAAFKCVSEGKQCALLVPTTILAWQHYNTAINRFGELPIEVRLLSRFVTPTNQKKTVAGLKSGKVDMVIGTHRLISNDIDFKNIGLVIIDEEQRFGVAQKEKLKEKYPFVDILTLSATPIPRTLNMALSGLRDMSSIDEAPGDRQPVQTYVLEQSKGVILDAVRRELRRSGQVYYLHNRVESIVSCAARLKEELPEARIDIAHGKMNEEQLSDVWKRLLEHEIDILVCTTIIETGVDVPNVNTLIIEDADRMGLSQLHQLRGRVGRSARRAYAYFCFRRGKQLSEIAEKRLEAMREFTEFGSGYRIAMRDLEIRGAGSILGGEQHGNMEAVGYDMYIKLLNDAIKGENGEVTEEAEECVVDIGVSAFIPESYIESLPARLGIYKRIAKISTNEQKSDVIDELCDRFGDPPKAVMGLINVALLRNRAAKLGIYEIAEQKGNFILKVNKVTQYQIESLSKLSDRMTLSGAEKPFYIIKAKPKQDIAGLINEIAEAI